MTKNHENSKKTDVTEAVSAAKNKAGKIKGQTEETAEKIAGNIERKALELREEISKYEELIKMTSENIKEDTGKRVGSVKENFKDISELGGNQYFWENIQENTVDGVRIITEEAKDFAGKVASYSENIFGVVREKAEDVFKYGTNLTQDAVNYAQSISEKYKDRFEIAQLNEEKKKASSQLGMYIYLAYKNNDNKVPRQTFAQRKVKSVLKELEELDKKIIDMSEEK